MSVRGSGGDYAVKRMHVSASSFPQAVVAIPARDEVDDIGACLRSIAQQNASDALGVVCLVNNSTDETYVAACAQADALGLPARVIDVTMMPRAAHAGGARRAAMASAAEWLTQGDRADAVLLTTDADSRPAADWYTRIRRALARGVDGVAGTIDLFPEDEARLPAHLRARGMLEARYEELLTELFARLDPRPFDPWPCHATEAGANLAVTLDAFNAIGGLPLIPCGEDKALVAALDDGGFRVRHDPSVRVLTSGRLTGRAAGGVADTIRLRCEQPDAPCDPYLEPAQNARFRALWRGRLRRIFREKGEAAASAAFGRARDPMRGPSFGKFWAALEANDPRLSRTLLYPSELAGQIAAATLTLSRLRPPARPDARTDQVDNPLFAPAE